MIASLRLALFCCVSFFACTTPERRFSAFAPDGGETVLTTASADAGEAEAGALTLTEASSAEQDGGASKADTGDDGGVKITLKEAGASDDAESDGSTTDSGAVSPPEIAKFVSSHLALPGGGGTVNLSWSVTGAESLSIESDGSDDVGVVSGERVSVDIGRTTSYTLVATNAGGSSRASLKVEVSSRGDVDWLMQWGDGETTDVAVDLEGNLFVTGVVASSLTDDVEHQGESDVFLAKLSREGEVLWLQQLGSEASESNSVVAVDAEGHAYLAFDTTGVPKVMNLEGPEPGAAFSRLLVVKFSPEGEALWLEALGDLDDEHSPTAIVTGTDGDVLIATSIYGNRLGAEGNLYDASLFRLTKEGKKRWDVTLDFGMLDGLWGLVVGPDGGAVVVGTTSGDPHGSWGSSGNLNAFVAKFADDGDRLWLEVLEGVGHRPEGVGLDAEGNVFVSGWTSGLISGGEAALGGTDVFVAKLTQWGEWLWGKQLGSNVDDYASGAGVDHDGNVLVSAYTDGDWWRLNYGSTDYVLFKLSPKGEVLWGDQYGTSERDHGWAVAVSERSKVIVGGYSAGQLKGSAPTGGAFVSVWR